MARNLTESIRTKMAGRLYGAVGRFYARKTLEYFGISKTTCFINKMWLHVLQPSLSVPVRAGLKTRTIIDKQIVIGI